MSHDNDAIEFIYAPFHGVYSDNTEKVTEKLITLPHVNDEGDPDILALLETYDGSPLENLMPPHSYDYTEPDDGNKSNDFCFSSSSSFNSQDIAGTDCADARLRPISPSLASERETQTMSTPSPRSVNVPVEITRVSPISSGNFKLPVPDPVESESLSVEQEFIDDQNRFKPFHEEKWSIRYRQLLEFHDEHGHAAVPHSYPKNQQLARWVKRQRRQYKLRKRGGHQL